MAGLKDQVEGKAREIKGRITGDDTEQLAGKAQHKKGKLQSKLSRAKADVAAHAEKIIDKAK